MEAEINFKQVEIERALSELKLSTKALQASFPCDITGNNMLEVVDKLNKLNQTINQLTEAYKVLLLKNEELTSQSVQLMVEADLQISSSIKSRLGGERW